MLQFSLNPSKKLILYPKGTTVINTYVVEAGSDLATCINAGHVFKITGVNIPEMVVINGVSMANEEMQFTVRNLSNNELKLFPYETILVRID